MSKDCLFVGGFTGTGKESGKPFYALEFAYRPELQDQKPENFGFKNAVCFVNENTYDAFKKVPACTFIDAIIVPIDKGRSKLYKYNI